ncbi:MAG: hypothetical protein AAFZ87_18180, partial [Planctomycetota bacterium]
YLGSRYGLHDLPGDACSPVSTVEAGAKLLLDTQPRPLTPGDTVLLRVEGGTRLLALVERVRDEDGALWCGTDRAGCPGFDSEVHGWVPRNVVAGRVLLGFGGGER